MLLLAALIASSQTPSVPQTRTATQVEAQTMVRIMRPASLRVGDAQTLEGKPLRSTLIRSANGELVPARLAEFE
jgi:hypothetical protein